MLVKIATITDDKPDKNEEVQKLIKILENNGYQVLKLELDPYQITKNVKYVITREERENTYEI